MVKKVVNIGVEGNDASGDPIREAFNKVNENFNELYSAFGKGDGISITALAEGPDETPPNTILIMNDDPENPKYLTKELVGEGGIQILNTSSSVLTIKSIASALGSDTSPYLINNLDARGLSVLNVANPNQTVANLYNLPNTDSFAINKGYADSRYVNISGDTMTGPLSVPTGAFGTQVPRANETVLKSGGTNSQMTGPLILSDIIRTSDSPLTAATKEYVDLSNYASQIDLYVSTQGSDTLFDVDDTLKGRSYAYAFRTISAACRYAKRLMDESPLTVGITVKDITYNNGEDLSEVYSVVAVDDYFIFSITNDGGQTDPRDGFDIRPGQIIKGKVSGAIVRIQEIQGLFGGYESYRVVYVTDPEENPFIVGEPLEYGNPTKDLNISIYIETGNYYEHYPIRIPENVSIIGAELRRTIVRPRPGRSASWSADTYFRRDQLFDVNLPVADQTFGYHYLTDSGNVLYTGTINNTGAYVNASYILLQNKEYIINEVIGYLNTVEINGTINLFYDEEKCKRDTGLIITALAYDMLFDSNFASIAAARSYYRGTQAAAVLGNDKIATLDALDQLKIILIALVSGSVSEQRISNNIDLMKLIIDDGLSNIPVITWPNTSSIVEGFANAKTLIANNKEFLKAEISAYISQQIAANVSTPSSIWFGLELDLEKCRRDVQYIVEAVIYDLGYGGNWQTVDAAAAYYIATSFIINSNEKLPTLEAYERLKERIYAIATNGAFTNYQNVIPRTAGGQPGTTAAGIYASDLVELIRYTITNDGLLPTRIYPGTASISTEILDNFNLMNTNNTTIQNDIITYLNENYFIYDEVLCRRDLGLVIDAIGYDLVYGDYYKSLEAANSYFTSASALLVIQDPTLDPSDPFYNEDGQLQKTLAGFQRLSFIAQRVVLKQPPSISYQNLYPSNLEMETSMEEVSESGADTVVSQLFEFMIKIINRDASFNPPKQNNELDVFLMNNGTIIRQLSCQEHGGFMCVLDPEGQILTKSPYVQTASSFSRSIEERIFAGGMFCDAFAGNIQANIVSKVSDIEILIDGLTVRLPNLPCAFYVSGVRFQVDLITEWNQTNGTARVHINPQTPDTLAYMEDYGDFTPPLFTPGTYIEFLSAGNNSMLSNDYTQLNDLGYGLVAVNGGLLEAVSVFTYYCQISYFADTGGQIRSVSGSSAHGAYALVAKGAYPLEIPDDVYLLEDMICGAEIYSPYDYYNGVSGTNLSGTGSGATFNIIVNETSYVVTRVSGGTGYLNGNQIIFLGADFGGISGINDLTITITGVSGSAIDTFTYTGTIPEGAPVNDYFNRENDVTVYVTNVTPEFKISNGAELEVSFGNAPNKLLFRYLINNAEDVTDSGDFPVTPTTNVYRLNLASGGLGAGATGIRNALANGARVTMRQNQSLLIYDINRETATRPSTALVFDEATAYVNRVIAISNVNAKEGTFTWDVVPGTTIECNSSLHGLNPGDEIYLVFAAGSGTSGAPSRGFYTIVTTPTTSTFTVTANVATENYVEGTFTWGQANGECEVQLKEPFRAVIMNSYYNAVDFQAQPKTVSVDRAFTTINEFNCVSTSSLTANDPIKFDGTIGGITAGTTYYVKTIVSDTRFTISDTSGGVVRSLTNYTGGILTVTATTSGTNLITVASTSLLYTNKVVRFSGDMGGGLKINTPYYVLSGFTGTQFTVSLTPGGTAVTLSTSTNSMTVTLEPMYGTTDIVGSDYYTWGVTGSYKFAIRDLSTYDAQRIFTNIDLGFPMIMGWRGRVHKISNYTSSEDNGTPFAVIEIDNLGVVSLPLYPSVTGGLIEPIGYLEGGWDNAPNMKAGLQEDSSGNVTINISTVRSTGHDMLEVGTGSYASTNFPNVIFGRADRDSDAAAEVREIGKGRVFYVSSDQDGNFKVGDFFKVDQGTGTVTFSSSIAISNLDGLGFKRGVAVAEFSVDDSFFDNATDTVPTEQAVRTYIDRRLGITHNGAVINPASGRLIPTPTSGFMSLDGKLPMKAIMDMGSFRIRNLADPTLNQDATTKVYVDYFLRRQGGTSRIDVESFTMLPKTTFVSGTVSGITGSGPWTAVITLTTTTGVGVGYQLLADNGTGSIGTGVCVVTIVNSGLNQVTFTCTGGTTPTNGTVTNIRFFAGALNMNDNKIVNVATPTNDYDAATKLYVDTLTSAQNELRELGGVDLPNPITGITTGSLFVFNGTNFTWGAQTGDVIHTLTGNTLDAQIQPGVIINSDVNATAAIEQSKLNMTIATTRAAAPTGTAAQKQAASGLASFDSASFNITDGFVTLKGNGLTLSMLPTMSSDTVIGNSSASSATPGEVTFATVVQEGGALYKTDSIWTQNGALVRTGIGAFSVVVYKSAYSESTATDKGTLVLRDATDGGFSGSIINATTQFNVKGNRAINQSADATPFLEIRTPQDNISITTRTVSGTVNGNTYGSWNTNGGTWTNTGTWSLTGNLTLGTTSVTTSTINGSWTANGNWTIQNSAWVLAGTSTLESTYTADIAEYYQGDKEYEVGTVVMIGGEFDITLASGQGTTKVAGVISNNAAFMMYKECPGLKNLVALQGRVPCKVIGKVFKGDLMVVGVVPGVAMASTDPKPGSIIGKALQNYDSDHVGTIEIMVGKH